MLIAFFARWYPWRLERGGTVFDQDPKDCFSSSGVGESWLIRHFYAKIFPGKLKCNFMATVLSYVRVPPNSDDCRREKTFSIVLRAFGTLNAHFESPLATMNLIPGFSSLFTWKISRGGVGYSLYPRPEALIVPKVLWNIELLCNKRLARDICSRIG